jgi:hypothetical protein
MAQTCLGWGLNMFGFGFWNPVKNPYMSGVSQNIGLWIDFDD